MEAKKRADLIKNYRTVLNELREIQAEREALAREMRLIDADGEVAFEDSEEIEKEWIEQEGCLCELRGNANHSPMQCEQKGPKGGRA